ncbi:MAG: DUF4468 domain-containing protein [Chitinophagales bacterium]|nr:DUF4468 domain-containing protein [Chitinophagales bacterium]
MKQLSILFLALIACYGTVTAQAPVPIDKTTGHVVYTEVVNVNGASANDLYKRAYYWFNTFYTNPSSVIISYNESTGLVKGKHSIMVYDTLDGKPNKKGMVKYEIEIQAKEGRYKYTINEIYFFQTPKLYIEKWLDASAPNKNVQYGYLGQVHQYMTDLVANMQKTLSQPIPTEKKEDW